MDQNKKGLLSLIVAALIMLIVSVAVYFIGIKLAEMYILADASNGVQDEGPWKEYYYYLVQDMGDIAGAILLLWTALSHWGLPISGSVGSGKRWLWALFGVILIVACVVFPIFFSERHPTLAMDKSIQLLFCACYGLVGYWGGSIIVTSDRYQHTPLFARFFR